MSTSSDMHLLFAALQSIQLIMLSKIKFGDKVNTQRNSDI